MTYFSVLNNVVVCECCFWFGRDLTRKGRFHLSVYYLSGHLQYVVQHDSTDSACYGG